MRHFLWIPIILFCAANAPAVIIDRIAAIVNDDVITRSELDSVQQLGLHVSGLPDEPNVLEERIDHHLVLQQLQKQPPFTISPDLYQQTIDSYVQKYGGTEEFLTFLNSIGMNYQDFEKELREQLTIDAFIGLRFRPFVNVSLDEAEKYYTEVYKPEFEKQGKEPPAFAIAFDAVQTEIIESQVQVQTRKWLQDLRQTAVITVKT